MTSVFLLLFDPCTAITMGRRGASNRGGGGGGGRGGRGGRGGKKDGVRGDGGSGPRLHSKLLKELGGGRKQVHEDNDDDALVVKDLYEYEEGVAEEETGKNRRFDAVDGVEYELPSDFEVMLMIIRILWRSLDLF